MPRGQPKRMTMGLNQRFSGPKAELLQRTTAYFEDVDADRCQHGGFGAVWGGNARYCWAECGNCGRRTFLERARPVNPAAGDATRPGVHREDRHFDAYVNEMVGEGARRGRRGQ